MNRLVILSLLSVGLLGCEVKPQPINYGQDECHYCKMTIVDRQHSAQLVTVKGRSYKYDAIECMMNHLRDWDHPEVKYYLVADYSEPGVLVDACEASYLVSEAIPSPMGEFLSAFREKEVRDRALTENDGDSMDWEALKQEFEVPVVKIN